jgi:hypothetical protein
MADIKTIKGPAVFRPGLSEEAKAEAQAALDEYFVGAEQKMRGEARSQAVAKFVDFLVAINPDRLRKLEAEIKELHGMEKFQRFRTQFFLMMMDAFQGGMYAALDQKSIENEWDLLKLLGLAPPSKKEETKEGQ